MKKILAIMIALMPFNRLRIFLYRQLLNYKVSYQCYIGMFTIIVCKEVEIKEGVSIGAANAMIGLNVVKILEGSKIGNFNRFRSFNNLLIMQDVSIKKNNAFFGTFGDISPYKQYENLLIGSNSIITNKHIFDLSDEVSIGDDVTFGGSGSQVWTHGFDLAHTKIQASIKIGNHCYLGSQVMVMLGCNICSNVSIAGGTVVSKTIKEPGFYVSSQLEKKSDCRFYGENEGVEKRNGYKFYRKVN